MSQGNLPVSRAAPGRYITRACKGEAHELCSGWALTRFTLENKVHPEQTHIAYECVCFCHNKDGVGPPPENCLVTRVRVYHESLEKDDDPNA